MSGIAYVLVELNKPGERIAIVKQGTMGYDIAKGYDDPKESIDMARAFVAALNLQLNIPADVAQSAKDGSMFGWHVPAAQKAIQFFAQAGRKCGCCEQIIPPTPGTITFDPHHGELSCTCGNVSGREGFYPCDENGDEIDGAFISSRRRTQRFRCQLCDAIGTITEQQYKDAGLL
jgi:hypothetical protein